MGVVFSRLLQSVKLERDAFVWMDFNDRATGDAAMLVIGTQFLMALGLGTPVFSLIHPATLINVFIGALFGWIVYSGAVYVVSHYLLEGSGNFAIYLRTSGFAYPTLLLVIVTGRMIPDVYLALLAAGVWFVVIVANGLSYVVDLSIQKAFAAAVGGLIVMVIAQSILGSLRF